MGDKRNYAALEWVIGEIRDALNEARQALEAYAEDPRDITRIRFCLTHIHQVLGSLKMVEFHGAALFAEEMELLAGAIVGKTVHSETEALEVLMRSLLQLPIYLDHVKRVQDDHPGVILPLLNDLRAARKEPYLSETNLFTPELKELVVVTGARHPLLTSGPKLKEVLKKLFEMYQYAAASVLRGVKIEENLIYVSKVFTRLENTASGTIQANLWQMANALVDSLIEDEIELSVAVKGLFRRFAKEIKRLYENAPDTFNSSIDETLARNILYYVARSASVSECIAVVKSRYLLANALFEGPVEGRDFHKNMISAPEPDTIRSVVSALREEMNTVKQILIHVVNEDGSVADLEAALPVVKRVADTLAVLGVADLRHATNRQHDSLVALCQSDNLDKHVLTEVANQLVGIEHRLEAIAKDAGKTNISHVDEREIEVDEAKVVVLKECRLGLERLKEGIVEFYSSQWNKSALSTVAPLIKDIRGGLGMIPLARASSVVAACGDYIQKKFIEGEVAPSSEILMVLANAIEGVDYYLDRLVVDFNDDVESFLSLAEDALRELGCLSDDSSGYDHECSATNMLDGKADNARIHDKVIDDCGAEPILDDFVEFESSESDKPPILISVPVGELVDSIESRASFGEPSAAAERVSFILAEGVDDDIAEIFVEEAREVIKTLAEVLPQWFEYLENSEHLSVIRRAFHTLKGSGRMVKADVISELSWSVENLLNRVIDRSVSVAKVHTDFITKVYTLLPALIDAFEQRYIPSQQTLAKLYETWGYELGVGNTPAALLEADDLAHVDEFCADNEEGIDVSEIAADSSAIEQDADDDYKASESGAVLDGDVEEVFDSVELLTDSLGEDNVDTDEEDSERLILWELFASEAQTHLAAVDEFIVKMESDAPIYGALTDGLQRALHTLKGSAHMAGVSEIAQLAAPLELFVKELRIYQVPIDTDILQLIKDAAEYCRLGIEFTERNEDAVIPKLDQFVARVGELKEVHLGHLIHAKDAPDVRVAHPVDPRMLAIFMAEEIKLLLDADEVLERWQIDLSSTHELPAMMTELKTLEIGAAQANFPSMAQLSGQLHDLYSAALEYLAPDNAVFDVFRAAHNTLLDMIDAVAAAQTLPDMEAELQNKLDEYLSMDDVSLQASEPTDGVQITSLEGYSAGDDDLDLSFMAGNSDAVSNENAKILDAFTTDDAFELGVQVLFDVDSLESLEDSDRLECTSVNESDSELLESLTKSETAEAMFAEGHYVAPESSRATHEPNDGPFLFMGGDPSHIDADDFDGEIVEIFMEEAEELLEQLDEAIHEWESDLASKRAPEEMTRALHTLKGGARLSGLSVLGELTHEYETYLINSISPDRTPGFFDVLHQYQDLLLQGIRGVNARMAGESPATVVIPDAIIPYAPNEVVDDSSSEQAKDSLDHNAKEFNEYAAAENPASSEISTAVLPDFVMSMVASQGSKTLSDAVKKSASQEVVKISSELLEELVNLAGETSISRGRIQQQVSDFGSAIGEIDITLSRLQEQLRRLDIETEAQIVFRQEQLADNEEFDPLEMDRYSQLQQLSRSLTESASDLVDLKRTLSEKVKDTESILLQQQRINSSLQEGLMRARMVPFSRMVPRLRRIVRQVASELNKQVSFELDNVEGEMDRSVLEHMVAPLEHMLRNAVDHGIEDPSERLAAGKSESGRILLSFAREGGDILLRLADDGKGIALDKVRKKAIERGLMAADADLSDHDIMQFILQAGFSTAENVTQISGRGVGMDVVAAEIKQLGGSMTIESKPGVGTQFTVRLPFTVSVNRALMVSLGKESYAIPLNTIEGIVRVSPFELEHYYGQSDARFEYAGESYEVRYLGGMLYDDMAPRLDGQVMPLPVILVRSAQHTMALQVDSLMGSREIVVKSIGSQFSSVQGLSGATVMGDGSVVVILDPHALVRKAVATIGLASPSSRPILDAPRVTKTVMVVDDSVTVRKVTTRFLEREGFNVITAKDGVDALQVLQSRIPDIMLLDIEMPRMDGFEVAKNMRTSDEWAHIPIIMITSRTGEKHRDHAMSIGVNNYLGKPYQEELLLESINKLLGA
ncbi:MAG: Hpt domain-containing protein [Marinagarivorans sp.]|nr:Hpt domain-containing protein [Marinagarivorans sp.]